MLLMLCGFAWYMGLFLSLEVKETSKGPWYLLYQKYQGDYAKIGPLFEKIRAFADKEGIAYEAMFGIYYDDPKKTAKEKLRAEAGLMLDAEGFALYQKNFAKSLIDHKPIFFKELPLRDYIAVHFPFRNMLSIWLGVLKAYPTLDKYAKQKGYPEYEYKEKDYQKNFAMEIYEKEYTCYLLPKP